MKSIALDELKLIQIDLLQKIADFCESQGLRYFLCGGTLIGAIRHKGFIPWDDDLDIMVEPINPTAAAHCGPDTIGITFYAIHR